MYKWSKGNNYVVQLYVFYNAMRLYFKPGVGQNMWRFTCSAYWQKFGFPGQFIPTNFVPLLYQCKRLSHESESDGYLWTDKLWIDELCFAGFLDVKYQESNLSLKYWSWIKYCAAFVVTEIYRLLYLTAFAAQPRTKLDGPEPVPVFHVASPPIAIASYCSKTPQQ